jgi:predicted ATPase/class 3 adenylate cyclase
VIVDANNDIVTLLFTDIEGSTEMWERDPERMAHALARHDVLLRAAVEARRGRVIKTTGDGIYAAFADPADCVEAAIAIQVSIADPAETAGMQLSVRCGLHAGPTLERDNDFFGSTINRAARIMGLAYGGQVLASQAVVDRVEGNLPAGAALRDLGGARLKGMANAERVYQIVHRDLRQAFPALRSLVATPNNLPEQLTSFVGREREIMEAEALLERARMLTLLGMGGMGKTRLALQIAGDVLDGYLDGAWFVDLAPIRESSLVASETAKVLGVRAEPETPISETLCADLKPRKLLLILDNCEHLIQPSAELANLILRFARGVRIIATSRVALQVSGEQTYPVLPLPVPARTDKLDVLSRSTAVRLFVDRAQLRQPTFVLGERDSQAVGELVARLEGIPLALELAAARVRTMSVTDINARLNDRYRLLTGGDRVLLPRQQTLRALVDWSYDLLNQSERTALNRLSVFIGSFDLEAAEQVCSAEPLESLDILDIVTSLVDKSLIGRDDREQGTRYRILETIRDYAREKLEQAGELASTAARHCHHYFALAKAIRDGLRGSDAAQWSVRGEADLDNIRAAIALAMHGGVDPLISVKIAVAMQNFWILRGYCTEGRGIVRSALALPAIKASNVAQGYGLYVGAALAVSQSDYLEARNMLRICLDLRRRIGDLREIAGTLSTLALAQLRAGEATEAREDEQEALTIFRQCGDRVGEAIVQLHLGQIAQYVGDEVEALARLEESRAIAREIKHPETEGESELVLGQVALDAGDQARAREHFNRSLAICQEAADKRGEANAYWWLAKADLEDGLLVAAGQRLTEALRAFRAFEMREELLGCLEDFASLAQAQGLTDVAVRLAAASAASRHRLNLIRRARGKLRWQAQLDSLRQATTSTAFATAWDDGQTYPLEHAVRIASSMSGTHRPTEGAINNSEAMREE